MDGAPAHHPQATGRLDILVNNPGVAVTGPTAEMPLSEIIRVHDTNVIRTYAAHSAVERAGLGEGKHTHPCSPSNG